jgi:hypothetical protein
MRTIAVLITIFALFFLPSIEGLMANYYPNAMPIMIGLYLGVIFSLFYFTKK